jgi:hypothetical protein
MAAKVMTMPDSAISSQFNVKPGRNRSSPDATSGKFHHSSGAALLRGARRSPDEVTGATSI